MRSLTDANLGRGVFSHVLRAGLSWSPGAVKGDAGAGPASVVVKLPVGGVNGTAARSSGAYRREALAYRDVLGGIDVDTPFCHFVDGDDEAAFVLEDLGSERQVDQLEGLGRADAGSVVEELARLHRHWIDHPLLARLPVRRSTPSGLEASALSAGVEHLRIRWSDRLEPRLITTFEHLLAARATLVDRFVGQSKATLCHGDPRADNLAFRATGRAALFDWQQIAVQFGEADVAWLAATSLVPGDRRRHERDLVTHYGGDFDRYRLGFTLPGLAVLMLAQRELTTDRMTRFVEVSLQRIATALDDLDVPDLGR